MRAAAARVDMGETSEARPISRRSPPSCPRKDGRPRPSKRCARRRCIRPDDEDIRERLLDLYFAAGELERARECVVTPGHFKSARCGVRRRRAERRRAGDAARGRASRSARRRVARAPGADVRRERQHGGRQRIPHGPDRRRRSAVADHGGRAGAPRERRRRNGGRSSRARAGSRAPRRHRALGWKLAGEVPEVAFKVVGLAAETAVVQADWASAAAVLQEFVTRVPNHIPALMRLVEICVDGGLEATMYRRRRSWPTRTSPRAWGLRRGSSPRISSRASRGSKPTSSGSAARSCCWARRIPTA